MGGELMGHPKADAVTVSRDDLEAAFARWDAESAVDSSGDPSPAGRADYFFRLLIEGKSAKG